MWPLPYWMRSDVTSLLPENWLIATESVCWECISVLVSIAGRKDDQLWYTARSALMSGSHHVHPPWMSPSSPLWTIFSWANGAMIKVAGKEVNCSLIQIQNICSNFTFLIIKILFCWGHPLMSIHMRHHVNFSKFFSIGKIHLSPIP